MPGLHLHCASEAQQLAQPFYFATLEHVSCILMLHHHSQRDSRIRGAVGTERSFLFRVEGSMQVWTLPEDWLKGSTANG